LMRLVGHVRRSSEIRHWSVGTFRLANIEVEIEEGLSKRSEGETRRVHRRQQKAWQDGQDGVTGHSRSGEEGR
jgi:hypothetical protein